MGALTFGCSFLLKVICRLCVIYVGGDNDFNVQAMITRLMWTIWTSLSAVRERLLNLITHSLTLHTSTNHNKQHYILMIMQQNCQITGCARQHTVDSVLKSAKLRRDLTGNRNGFTHARSALHGRVSRKLDELLGDKFANHIPNKISTFSTQ